jgi:hypothetical protein
MRFLATSLSAAIIVAVFGILGTPIARGQDVAPPVTRPGEVQQRFDRQQQRIDNGVRTGGLTRGEAARDEHQLRSDERLRNRQLAHDDGHGLTAAQRAHDNGRLNGNSGRIYNTKHNDVTGVPR